MTPSKVTGNVVVATTDQGVAGVQVELFSSGNGVVPLASAATDESGAYTFGRLPAGRYRIRVTGAGFDEQWFKTSQTFAGATDIDVAASAEVLLEDLVLGGRPWSIAGEVVVEDPTGAVARLVVPGVADENAKALVEEVTVSADGAFLFEDAVAATYQLVVDKEGFATEVRAVVLRGPEPRGHRGRCAEATASCRATCRARRDRSAALPSRPPVATPSVDGELDARRRRRLRRAHVADAGAVHADVRAPGYGRPPAIADLSAGQQLPGLSVTLAPTTGSISGTVSQQGVGPVGGVTVTVRGPEVERSTTTAASAPGSYVFDDLPVPATYTITFAKSGLVSQSRLEDLDPLAGRATATGVDTLMVPSTATISGTVRSADGTPVAGAEVLLNDGSATPDGRSADDPLGRFRFSGVKPGAYTLTATLQARARRCCSSTSSPPTPSTSTSSSSRRHCSAGPPPRSGDRRVRAIRQRDGPAVRGRGARAGRAWRLLPTGRATTASPESPPPTTSWSLCTRRPRRRRRRPRARPESAEHRRPGADVPDPAGQLMGGRR